MARRCAGFGRAARRRSRPRRRWSSACDRLADDRGQGQQQARVRGGLEHEAYLWHDLKGLIDEAGGKDRLLACGGVFSGPFQTQMVAYELGLHGIQVGWKVTPPPGVVFRTRTVPDGPLVTKPTDDRYRLVATNGKWRLLTVPPVGDGAEASPVADLADAGNVATKDAPLEVIGDPQKPQSSPDRLGPH